MAQEVRRTSYEYVMLAEATEREERANLYAVVVECSVPRPTRGTGETEVSSTVCCRSDELRSQVVPQTWSAT